MKYEHIKALNIFMTSLMIPMGTFTGYQLAAGNFSVGSFMILLQTLLVFFQATVWWRTAELIGTRTSL
jgi:hypothetical protein